LKIKNFNFKFAAFVIVQWILCTYIFGSSNKCFPVANIRIIGLDPLDLFSTKEWSFVLHEKWECYSLNIYNVFITQRIKRYPKESMADLLLYKLIVCRWHSLPLLRSWNRKQQFMIRQINNNNNTKKKKKKKNRGSHLKQISIHL
jgi:hypothetical protein